MKALVYIFPKEGILDPEGLTVRKALQNLGMKAIDEVRMGRYVELDLPKVSRKVAEKIAREACERLLVNSNIEAYRFKIAAEN